MSYNYLSILKSTKTLSFSEIPKSNPYSFSSNSLKIQRRNLGWQLQVSIFSSSFCVLIIEVCGHSPLDSIHPLGHKIFPSFKFNIIKLDWNFIQLSICPIFFYNYWFLFFYALSVKLHIFPIYYIWIHALFMILTMNLWRKLWTCKWWFMKAMHDLWKKWALVYLRLLSQPKIILFEISLDLLGYLCLIV